MTRTEIGTVAFLIILSILQIADSVTTRMVMEAGGSEGNPIMAGAAESLTHLLAVKSVGIGLIVALAWYARTSRALIPMLGTACLIYWAIVANNLVNLAGAN